MASRRVKRFLWALVITALAVFALRTFVGDVYRVHSTSMEPGAFEGELVLMLRDRSVPERGGLVALRNGDESFIKRVVGLPGESVRISGGDVLIKGVPAPAPGREPVLVFDDRRQSIAERFERGGAWTESEGGWELDARAAVESGPEELLSYHPRLLDGYFRAGEWLEGTNPVNDAAVELEFLALEPSGRFLVRLVEQGDTFELAVQLPRAPTAGDGRTPPDAELELWRHTAEAGELMGDLSLPLAIGRWRQLWFSNIDNRLEVAIGGETVLTASYARNTFDPEDVEERGLSFGHRVILGGEGCRVRVRGLRIFRDQFYTDLRGPFGVERACELQIDEIFVLGDNSRDSLDSRELGPVHVDRILGRPLWVVWPPHAIRRL